MKNKLSIKNKYLDKLLSDSYFRLLVSAAFTSSWDFIYGCYHFALAIIGRSYWFLTMGFYYMAICCMRSSALRLKNDVVVKPVKTSNLTVAADNAAVLDMFYNARAQAGELVNDARKNRIRIENEIVSSDSAQAASRGKDIRTSRRAVRRNAILIFALAIVFSGIVCLTIAEKRNRFYNDIIAISMAAYTFFLVTLAIINLIKLRNDRTVQKILLRNCSMVSAIGSLFGLERTLLGTFGNSASKFTVIIESASGAGFFIIIVLFGINLLILANNRHTFYKNKIKK